MVSRHVLLCFWLVIFLSSCAGLPARLPHSGPESLLVRQSFKELVGRQRQCESSVDAEITITLDSRWYSGTMSGYLQAKAPAFLKLVGINPFGQPLVVLVSDGESFSYASLSESLSYDGRVDSDTFQRFVPTGFDPSTSFYPLTGKLAPGEMRILTTSSDQEGRGAWLELENIQDNIHSLVLFEPERQLIRQYLRLNEDGKVTLKIGYNDYYPGPCSLPGLVTISSSDHAGELSIRLHDWQTDTPFSAADFALELPPVFKRVKVN
ncbi:MAG: hypothetical protein ABFS18_06865 [Thermodesulfobacteriota bacterium]